MSVSTDFAAITARQRDTWAAGNFSLVATHIVVVGELLCDAIPLLAGRRVLDIAAGSGNTALAAARRGCDVIASDYVPTLLQDARHRADVEKLPLEIMEADAQALPFADASFDVVLSTFGIMFAPDQLRACSEALRVCKPGGTLAFASWTPQGFIGDIFRATAQHVPPPPGVLSAMRWGDESVVRDMFGTALSDLRMTRTTAYFRFLSAPGWVEFMRTYYGPTLRAFGALDEENGRALEHDLVAVAERHNVSGDATMLVPAEYLQVIATKR